MKKNTYRLLAVLSVSFFVASGLAMASTVPDGIILDADASPPQPMEVEYIHHDGPPPPITLPGPIRIGGGPSREGPVGIGLEISRSGSAIVAPRGGAMMSPAQRSDREIRTVIRRLG